MTTEEKIKEIQEFANKHKVIYDDEGTVGFGRECVGLRDSNKWVAYNPTNYTTYENIAELYSGVHYEIQPEDAYHKDDFICVLGRGEKAITQLHEWVKKLEEHGAEIVEYETGATGVQAMLSGLWGKAVKIIV